MNRWADPSNNKRRIATQLYGDAQVVTLIDYWGNSGGDANQDRPGFTDYYRGEALSSEILADLITDIFDIYMENTIYSMARRNEPQNPTEGIIYRDCSSFLFWLLYNRGFHIEPYNGNAWTVNSFIANWRDYEIEPTTREPGDLMTYVRPGTDGTGGTAHIMLYIGNGYYIDCSTATGTGAVQQRSYYLQEPQQSICRYFRIPTGVYP